MCKWDTDNCQQDGTRLVGDLLVCPDHVSEARREHARSGYRRCPVCGYQWARVGEECGLPC